MLWDVRLSFAHPNPATLRNEKRLSWNPRDMRHIFRIAVPFGVISMLIGLHTAIPRYFLEAKLGGAELGIFSAIASLLTAGRLVVTAFGQSVFVRVANAVTEGNRAQFRAFAWISAGLAGGLGLAAVGVSMLAGREILAMTFRPEYGGYKDVLVVLMIAGTGTFISSALGYVATAARCLASQIALHGFVTIATLAASAWAIPRHGLAGAVDTTIVAAIVQLAGTVVILAQIDRSLRPAPMRELPIPECEPCNRVERKLA
jgi:O-antigen/teichoic acid export membrane protein